VVGGVYRPVTTLTYLINYAILGSRNHPASYNWVNIALDWLSIVLVFQLVLRVLRDAVLRDRSKTFCPMLRCSARFTVPQ
jgi:hypothetical protein